MVRLQAFLLGVVLTVTAAAVAASAAEGPGALTVEVVPAKVTVGGGSLLVRVANSGGAPVTGVSLDVKVPNTLRWVLDRRDLGTIGPGASALVALSLTGAPGTAVVQAGGQSGDIPVSAAADVELAAGESHTLSLVGNTRLTERSPAELRILVGNASDATVKVELSASAGRHRATLDQPSFELGPRKVLDVPLTVESAKTLRRGAVGVVVQAMITGLGTQHLVATRELAVALAADELPGPLGVSSLVVLPGLVALLAFFEIRAQDRKRLGLPHPGAKAVWDNKAWLLLAAGLSLAAAGVYDPVVGRDVLDAPLVRDITVMTVAVGGAGAVAALLSIWHHRRSTPIITKRSSPEEVLRAAQRSSNQLERARYKVGDKHGLLVHRDGDALVLSPPISFEPTGTMFTAWDNTTDSDRFRRMVDALPANFDGAFNPSSDDIPAPTAVPIDDVKEVGRAELLVAAP